MNATTTIDQKSVHLFVFPFFWEFHEMATEMNKSQFYASQMV